MHGDYSLDYVRTLSTKRIIKLLIEALDRDQEKQAWSLYVSVFPLFKLKMAEYVDFKDFYKPIKVFEKKEEIKAEDVLDKVKEILSM